MGSPDTEAGRSANEGPQTLVTLTEGFFMDRFEARYRDWLLFFGNVPLEADSGFTNYLEMPLRYASWSQATHYCALRTASELAEGKIPPGAFYRLPTEAEWEYACRAGSTTVFSFGNELRSDAVRVDAAFDGRLPYPTNIVPVGPVFYNNPVSAGTFVSNAFGLYDLHGNAEEWWLDGNTNSTLPAYPGGAVTNPLVNLGAFKIVRGGVYSVSGNSCRSAARRMNATFSVAIGFRVVIPGLIQTNLQVKLTPGFNIAGPIGSMQQIQYSTNLGNPNAWTVLSHVRLDVSPKPFFDTTATSPQRFYRTLTVPLTDTNLVWISSGTFLMRSPDTEEGRTTNEGPQTLVTFTHGFFMGAREVTYGEWLPFLPDPDASDIGDPNYLKLPVRKMFWADATNYCALRTASEQAAGKIPCGWAYRLPAEAEWEYACRAGSTTAFSLGNQLRSDALRVDANFAGSSPYPSNSVAVYPTNLTGTTIAGTYNLNAFGLYDMHGNVEEWCLDGTIPGTSTPLPYPGGAVSDPVANMSGTFRIVRGGWYFAAGNLCRSASRRTRTVDTLSDNIGFRVVLAPVGP